MSVLTQVLRSKEHWHYLCEKAEKRRLNHAQHDWMLYVIVGVLTYIYRSEVLSFLKGLLEELPF